MFKKINRYSFKKGIPIQNLNTEMFNLRYQKNEEGILKCAFVVGKKIDKRSVVRHRIKRRFANALKEIVKDNNVEYDLVFFIKKTSNDAQYLSIKEIITASLEKAKII